AGYDQRDNDRGNDSEQLPFRPHRRASDTYSYTAVIDGCRPYRLRSIASACVGHYRARACSAGTLRELWPILVDADPIADRARRSRRNSACDHDRKYRELPGTDADRDIEESNR